MTVKNAELLDVIDHLDNVTGRLVTKTAAHKELLAHRIAVVLVFRQNGKLLVQVHKTHDRRFDHTVGGHVRSGESYLEAAEREMKEEVNLDAPLEEIALHVSPIKRKTSSGGSDPHWYGIYKTIVSDDWQFVPNDEVDEIIEKSLEEIVADMNQNPNTYLTGFLRTLAVYLESTNSTLRIEVDGIDWGKL